MFESPFSFEGRIRRAEFGLSIIIHLIIYYIILGIINATEAPFFIIFIIPLLFFIWAQGAKRCHDLGKSGWWQLIPFYVFWLLFADGEVGSNKYGSNPKGIQSSITQNNQSAYNTSSSSTYQGGYNGGHNNPGDLKSSSENNSSQISAQLNVNAKNDGYEDGSLYK